ncbi:hypothetical protein HDU81_005052 [Chytriomyces hyalinus]|nr:hypothetical protein HDU81_005052 [Chytriomyces hyalinus]
MQELIDLYDWSLIVPGTNSNDANEILNSNEREFVLRDEKLRVFIVACRRENPASDKADFDADSMRDLRISVGVGGSTALFLFDGAGLLSTNHNGATVSLFPVLVTAHSLESPLVSLAATVQSSLVNPNLNIHSDLTICDPVDFDAPNILDGLSDDPFFNPNALPVHRLPFQFKRHSLLQLAHVPICLTRSLLLIEPFTLSARILHPTPKAPILSVLIRNNLDLVKELDAYSDAEMDATLLKAVKSFVENSRIQILAADAVMSNAVLKPVANLEYPLDLFPSDKAGLLFQVFNLNDSQQQTVSTQQNHTTKSTDERGRSPFVFSINLDWRSDIPGTQSQIIASRWSCTFDGVSSESRHNATRLGENHITDGEYSIMSATATSQNVPKSVGLSSYDLSGVAVKFENDASSSIMNDGFELSFRVMPPVFLRRVFTVELLLVNSSHQAKNLKLTVPQKIATDFSKDEVNSEINRYTEMHMPSDKFLRRLSQIEQREGTLFCLETEFLIGKLAPGSCHSVHLHFIALRGNLHSIEAVDIEDLDTKKKIQLKDCLQVYAQTC